jgi:hypothetical protein
MAESGPYFHSNFDDLNGRYWAKRTFRINPKIFAKLTLG